MNGRTQSEPAVDPEARKMPEYNDGKQAFFEGRDVDDCPHG